MKKNYYIALLFLALSTLIGVGGAYQCEYKANSEMEVGAYSYPDYIYVSEYDNQRFSQFDGMVIKKLIVNFETNCRNMTITPNIEITMPNGEMTRFWGLEEVPLENGTVSFVGIAKSTKGISDLKYLMIPGEYRIENFSFETDGVPDGYSGGGIIATPTNSTFKIDRLPRTDNGYGFTVTNTDDLTKIKSDNLCCVIVGVFSVLIIINIITDDRLRKTARLWKGFVRYLKSLREMFNIIFLCFIMTLLVLWLFMIFIKKTELVVNDFSFIGTASTLFGSFVIAGIGWKLSSEINKKGAKK